jgi:hypothetical protein
VISLFGMFMPHWRIKYVKDSFYKKLECVFYKFPKYHINSLLNFSAKLGKEDIFKPTIWNENLHTITNDNGVQTVNFATTKNLTVSCDGKIQIFTIL